MMSANDSDSYATFVIILPLSRKTVEQPTIPEHPLAQPSGTREHRHPKPVPSSRKLKTNATGQSRARQSRTGLEDGAVRPPRFF